MTKDIRIKKGLSINIKGSASKKIEKLPLAKSYALNLQDFHLVMPKLTKKVDDHVKRGESIFYSKTNEELVFVSPISGKIKDIVRGERRKILNIIVESDGKDSFVKNKPTNLKKCSADDLKSKLLSCGLWPFIKQRPFDIIADPNLKPKSIHVSCFDSAPLSVDFEFILKNNIDVFKTGLDALEILCPNNVNLGIKKCQSFFSKELSNYNTTVFDGPHPSGNVGVQIHHINPINSGEVVWVVKPEDVVTIGNFVLNGEYNPERTVAISGPPVENPMYLKTRLGVELKSIIKKVKLSKDYSLRLLMVMFYPVIKLVLMVTWVTTITMFQEAIEQLEKFSKNGKNFFLVVGMYRPHTPYVAPKKYFDMYDMDEMEIPYDGSSW